jgi:hypothetical protein
MRLAAIVDLCDRRGRFLRFGRSFVGNEIVNQAVDDGPWAIADIAYLSIDKIVAQYGDDLVIGFPRINHSETTNGAGVEQNVAMHDLLFGQDANIERISVCARYVLAGTRPAVLGGTVSAKRPRDKAVECGADIRIMLRPFKGQMAADFIEFVFHRVSGNDFDVASDNSGRFIAGGDAVPGMRPEHHAVWLHVLKVARPNAAADAGSRIIRMWLPKL